MLELSPRRQNDEQMVFRRVMVELRPITRRPGLYIANEWQAHACGICKVVCLRDLLAAAGASINRGADSVAN